MHRRRASEHVSSRWREWVRRYIAVEKECFACDRYAGILPGGPMFLKGGAAILPAVQHAVSFAREKGALIVWVIREHHTSGRDVERFRRHHYTMGQTGPTVKGMKGSALVDGLQPQPEDQVIVKYRFSAFFGTNLHSVLHSAGIESVIVTGVQTPNCIRQTVFDAVAHDYPNVVVLSDATGAASPEVHDELDVLLPTTEEMQEYSQSLEEILLANEIENPFVSFSSKGFDGGSVNIAHINYESEIKDIAERILGSIEPHITRTKRLLFRDSNVTNASVTTSIVFLPSNCPVYGMSSSMLLEWNSIDVLQFGKIASLSFSLADDEGKLSSAHQACIKW